MRIVETTYAGLLSIDEVGTAARETLAQARAMGAILLLADCTMLVGGHSVVDLYYLAEMAQGSGMDYRMREALVMPRSAEARNFVTFWEKRCQNLGWQVRTFTDRASAIDWLLETEPTDASRSASDAPGRLDD